jgi:class 3 adenylate cyclase/tetratricopeptide (TPR) repeat protein
MIACPSCATELPEGSRFCLSCGARIAAPAAAAEERKTVTTLFCDLVAFTAMSEAADPEDVDALLREYFAWATKVIESHGGTVEKFIGDAVVGVFGVPAAHEDDPERAVRAGLRILEALEDSGLARPDGSPLQARCGVNTGEALVRLDVDSSSGRGFLTGDAVNVAARLQAAAPPMGVVVGEPTWAVTHRAFAYEELEPLRAKGKAEPVPVWLALSALARSGTRLPASATPFIGRQVELSYLRAVLDKAAETASPQVALIIGEPGIGKSRLIGELFACVDSRPEMITWRQGRCLSYGEGVTFWALAEIVKAQAGILETDDGETVETKLEAVLPEGEDRLWLRQRLRALLGLEAAKAEREENFTARLRFVEELASREPTVLIFEDLHWADDAFLAFVEHLAGHIAHVPLMIIATARPELFERHPTFAASARVNRIALEPLSESETEELVTFMLDEVSQGLKSTIAQQAQGNPFFAEEAARLVRDRAHLVGQTVAAADATLAGSVQAVIAARLDALPAELKAVLTDASVVGEVFWDGVLAEMGERSTDVVEGALHELALKQLVHHVHRSAVEGEHEYAFAHALARDVAYGQLPRAVRASKHASVAAWIESRIAGEPGDLTELLAHHYSAALAYAQASGQGEAVLALTGPAMRYLVLAGDRVLALDVAAAERLYGRALRLAPIDHPGRPALLAARGEVLYNAGRYPEAVEALDEAVAALEAVDDIRRLALAKHRLWNALEGICDPRSAQEAAAFPSVLARLEAEGPSPELVEVLTRWGLRTWIVQGQPTAGLEAIQKAIDLAAELGLREPAFALFHRAAIRADLGDLGGLEDMETAIAAARAQGLGEELCTLMVNRAVTLSTVAGPRSGAAAFAEARDLSRGRGQEAAARLAHSNYIECLADMGAWDEALAKAEIQVSACAAASDRLMLLFTRTQQLIILTRQGRVEVALPCLEEVVAWERKEASYWQDAFATLTSSAAYRQLGKSDAAHDTLSRWVAQPKRPDSAEFANLLTEAVRTALSIGDVDLAGRVTEGIEPVLPPLAHALVSAHALLAEAHGEYETAAAGFADAAARWHGFGVPYEEGHALLGEGRCLLALGRAPEAAAPLAAALEIFARLGARPAQAETEALRLQVASA